MASSSAQQPIPPTQTQQPQTTTSSSNASTAAASIDGILCNDPSGLCLMSKGTMKDNEDSGAYTSLARLASQLSFLQQQQVTNMSNGESPLITIETDTSRILIKEYDGHAVAMKVPNI